MDKDVSNGLISVFLSDFVPIDLDEWWAQRFLENIDKLSWRSSGIRCSRTVWRWDRLTKEEEAWVGVLMGQSAHMSLKWTDSADNSGQRNSWEPLELVRSHSRADRLHTEGWSLKTEVHLIFSLSQQRCYFEMQ